MAHDGSFRLRSIAAIRQQNAGYKFDDTDLSAPPVSNPHLTESCLKLIYSRFAIGAPE